MGQKHLHELLKQDQEPFLLKNFIADRRSQLKSATTGHGKTPSVLPKRKPIIDSTSFCINHVCLFSSQDSPGFRNSPFLDFPTRKSKSPCNNAAVFLDIPARTAAMLLDAATRVQKPKPGSKQVRFGLLGSFLQRLKDRSSRTKSREIEPAEATVCSPATRRSAHGKILNGGGGDEERLSYSCNDNSRLSSGDNWSEKSSAAALETSCSSRSVHEFEEIECCCSNPSSPFHFSLQRSPSPTRRKTDCASPTASPYRPFQQEKVIYEVECPEEVTRQNDDEEEEQCSPVSVLDPLFDEDEKEHDDGVMKEGGYDIECGYANIQRAKHQLLQKLQRFERLAGLDPIKLENHMLEQSCLDEHEDDVLSNKDEVTNEARFREIMTSLGVGKIPWYMKKLVLDLIEEENRNEEHETMVERVCRRLQLWKLVDLNTIDMMVETDLRSEEWKWWDKEMIRDMGMDIEMAIFVFLVDEFIQDLF